MTAPATRFDELLSEAAAAGAVPGAAAAVLDPDGVVTVRGAPWRARTGRNRPVSAGGAIRVVAVDRLVLEVEPGEAPAEV